MSRARLARGSWLALGLAGALGLNLLLFGAAALMVRSTPERPALEAHPLSAFLPPLEEPPPPQETVEPPPPPPERPAVEMKSLRVAPPLSAVPAPLDLPGLEVPASPSLSLAPTLPALKGEFSPGEVDRLPMVAGRVPPVYPYGARRRGTEGAVKVRFLVDAKGEVGRIQVLDADPPGVFEEAVRAAVGRWRFTPGLKDGVPVATWVETTIRFELQGGS